MKLKKRLFVTVFSALKLLISTASSFSLIFSGGLVHAAQTPGHTSPLLTQSQSTQATIAKLSADIKTAAGGGLTPETIGAAIAEALATNNGVSVEMVAAAINQLKLDDATFSAALQALRTSLNLDQSQILTALITDTYMSRGRDAAALRVSQFAQLFGDEAVDDALLKLPDAFFRDAKDLAQIQPASGDVYDG